MVYAYKSLPAIAMRFRLRIIICTFIGALYFLYLLYSEVGYLVWQSEYFIYLSASIILANIVGFVIHFADEKLNQWLSWRTHAMSRLCMGIINHLLLSLLIITGGAYLFFGFYFNDFNFEKLIVSHSIPMIKLTIVAAIASLIYSIIYFALHSYSQYAVVHVDAAKNKRKQLQLQFEALKSQLSPHYLFNCLNTISSLVYKDAVLAEDFIRRLAQTYQYILTNNKRKFVLLEEEVEFVKSYNYLLQVRFQNNLQLEINLPPNVMDSKIPPLTLQMLVENAVKHNVIDKNKKLSIYISAIDNTDIRITNTKTETPAQVNSFHVGLENIKRRYEYFTTKQIVVENDTKFTVKLPVIKNEQAKSA
ncbi:hypothetical protein E1176_11210 [Fulvivirga sp. RKSG066]|uniref:sensor histidine kinase n=1 Tax=Fulvivirga aurantia TaxID=2529383 RepID=UPI0012BD7875|nr:histidine kinase [Fulvivirga aurantia]MTI21588.1 hypothetical protein [Fulvivirga aurantia]